MRASILKIAVFAAMTLLAEDLFAHANFTGYSGAPGSRGTCSISCHNRSATPTITVTGFPTEYVPGQQYSIVIGHQGGSTIKQFNASVRVGTGSSNGGVITSGSGTAVYNVNPEETNGVHFSSSDQNSGSFNWTAPAAGTGQVRLYWAGLQGNLSGGADTLITKISNEMVTGVDDGSMLPLSPALSQNYPNPFNSQTVIQFAISEPGPASLEICNILGQRMYHWSEGFLQAGQVRILWNGTTEAGKDAPSGVYFYRLETAQGHWSKKMVLLR